MKKFLVIFIVGWGVIPWHAFAATQKVFVGTVTNIIGTQLEFSTASGAYYTAQTAGVSLMRRYGSPLQFSEIIKGDKRPSCIIGFFDQEKKFRESKLIYFEDDKLKVKVLKHYAVYQSNGE